MKRILFFALMGLVMMGSLTSCKKDKVKPNVPADMFYISAQENNVQVSMGVDAPDQPSAQVSLLYSLDGINWSDFIVGQTSVTLANAGDKMYMKANNVNTSFGKEISEELTNTISFKFSQSVAVGGNIMYLLNGENPDKAEMGDYAFMGLFVRCKHLTDASSLILPTKLSKQCFSFMFLFCTQLTKAPELRATKLTEACYFGMFYGCHSLNEAPKLPATELAVHCYAQMFEECTSLQVAPELPATTLATTCYAYMFAGCTSLTSITCKATDMSAEDCLRDWLEDVTTTGVLHAAPSTDWTGKIPETWTVVYDD